MHYTDDDDHVPYPEHFRVYLHSTAYTSYGIIFGISYEHSISSTFRN